MSAVYGGLSTIPLPDSAAPIFHTHGHLIGNVHSITGQKGSRCIVLLFLNLGARWEWVVNSMTRPLYHQERPGIHCIGGWVALRASLEEFGKSCPPPGFDPRTVQTVASRYTDSLHITNTYQSLQQPTEPNSPFRGHNVGTFKFNFFAGVTYIVYIIHKNT
jgi:hypothetical protein